MAMSVEKQQPPGAPVAKAPEPASWWRLDRKRIAVAALVLLIIGGAVGWVAVHFWRDPNYRAAQEAIGRRDFAEAGVFLQKCLDAHPDDLDLRLLVAQTARRQGDLRTALGQLQACERRGAVGAELDLERRLLRVQQGDLADADDLLALCVKSPRAAQTPLVLEAVIEGSLTYLFGKFSQEMAGQGELSVADFAPARQAVDQWFELRTGRDDQVQGFIWRGKLASLARDHPKAQEAFREAVELDPENFAARELLAISISGEAPAEAARHLEKLRQRDPDNKKVTFTLARVCHTLGKLDQAEQLLDEFLTVHPDDVPALVERGSVALDRRKPQDAERWLQRAVQIAPDYPQANLLFSQCLQQTDRAAEAKSYHDRYLQIDARMRGPK